MPIYEYRCPECGNEEEAIVRFSEATNGRLCSNCGKPTERRISLPHTPIVPLTGRDTVLNRLNGVDGQGFPCVPRDRPRMEAAYAKGLDLTRPVIGKGF